MVRIAIDAMGGDHAPDVELDAVAAAVREARGRFRILLVGDRDRLEAGLARRGVKSGAGADVEVRHAADVIRMDDPPAAAVRAKRDASMRICFDLVKEGEADALVSAGNSGAMLACGTLVLGRLAGVERPGIVTTFPTVKEECALCDMGANVEPRPEALAQFGVLGAVYAEVVLGRARPRVGLLSNGAEESKGTELTRQAHALLRRLGDGGAGFDYVGYVEGKDIFSGDIDAVATDGFTGNVLLKTAEGAAWAMTKFLGQALLSSTRAKLGALLLAPALRQLERRLDPSETGGAPLLGVAGLVILCHGASSARAFKNAVFQAERFARKGLVERAAAAMARHAPVWAGTSLPDKERQHA